jgi:predicted acylesterase/phospholipase RssA
VIGMVRREMYCRPLSAIPGGTYLNLFRLLRGGRLARRLRRYCPAGLRLESLSPRLAIQCADLTSQSCVLLDKGPAVELVVASCSLPLFGKPYFHGNMVLADAWLMRNERARLHELLNVDLVVAVGTAWPEQPWSCPKTKLGTQQTVARSLRVLLSQWSDSTSSFDLEITPVVPGGFADMNPRRVDQLVELGREAARAKLPQLTALLNPRTPTSGVPEAGHARLRVTGGIC